MDDNDDISVTMGNKDDVYMTKGDVQNFAVITEDNDSISYRRGYSGFCCDRQRQ